MLKKPIYLLFLILLLSLSSCRNSSKTDRYAIVTSFNIENSVIDSMFSLSVGNGEFKFAVDVTGLQTFSEFYSHGNFLRTKSYWYKSNPSGNQLGLIGLLILNEDGKEISIKDISNPVQKLDLWTGEIDSKFYIKGVPVHLQTVCHPDYDMISVKIISGLIGKKRLKIKINFPEEASSVSGYNSNYPDKPVSVILPDTNNITFFRSRFNNSEYSVILWRNNADLQEINKQQYYLEPDRADTVYSFSCQYLNDPGKGRIQTFGETETASRKSWGRFWNNLDDFYFRGGSGLKSYDFSRDKILTLYLNKIGGIRFSDKYQN